MPINQHFFADLMNPPKDKTLLFRRRNIVESALYVKKKWGTIYGTLEMQYGRKGCEWLQKWGVDVMTY
jgi:hypothetical protein